MTPKYAVGDRVSFMGELIDFQKPVVEGTIATVQPDEQAGIMRYTVRLKGETDGGWWFNENELSPLPTQ